jgi:hypothetical protein
MKDECPDVTGASLWGESWGGSPIQLTVGLMLSSELGICRLGNLRSHYCCLAPRKYV